jgi:hypothetical protein
MEAPMRYILAALVALQVGSPAAPAPRLKEKPLAGCYWPTVVGATFEIQSDVPTLNRTEVVASVEHARGVTTVVTKQVKAPGKDPVPAQKVEIRADGVYLLETGKYPYDPPVRILNSRSGPATRGRRRRSGRGPGPSPEPRTRSTSSPSASRR